MLSCRECQWSTGFWKYLGYFRGSRSGGRSLLARLLGYSLRVWLCIRQVSAHRVILRTMTDAGGKTL